MRLSQELAKYYYTAAEARKQLGLDEEAFQYWVRKDRIKKVILPGRSQGVYSKKEVANLRDQINTTLVAEQDEGVRFEKATVGSIEKEAELAHLVFGEKARAVNERTSFLKKNPSIDFHLYDQDKLVAYINVVPLKHTAIEAFMQGKIGAWKISPDDIEPYDPDKPVECLIIDMVTTPTVPPSRRTFYGSRLLSNLLQTLSDAGKQGIEITKIYAASETSTGIRILKNAGFQIIGEARKGRFSFELDIANSNEKIIESYKESLIEWKKSQRKSQKSKKTRKTTMQSV